jgi:hypothetical protein
MTGFNYSESRWLNEVLPAGAVALTYVIRSNSLMPRQCLSIDIFRYDLKDQRQFDEFSCIVYASGELTP